jgi:four helix bundle protein
MRTAEPKGHRDLDCWQSAMALVKKIYIVTGRFPNAELYGLTSQLRRAAVSVPSNIAEGYGRKSRRELRKFVSNAIGSLLEVETQIEIARDLEYIANENAVELLQEIYRLTQLLNGLRSWAEKQIKAEG